MLGLAIPGSIVGGCLQTNVTDAMPSILGAQLDVTSWYHTSFHLIFPAAAPLSRSSEREGRKHFVLTTNAHKTREGTKETPPALEDCGMPSPQTTTFLGSLQRGEGLNIFLKYTPPILIMET